MEDKINNPSNLIIAGVAPWNEPDSPRDTIDRYPSNPVLSIHAQFVISRNNFARLSKFPLALSILSSRNNIKIRRKFSPPPPIKINLAWILRETNLGWDGIDLISNFEGIERMKPDREIPHEHEISWISSVNTAFFFCRVRIAWIFESVQRGRFVKKWETVSIKFTCIEFCVFDTFYILEEWNLFFDQDSFAGLSLMIGNYIARKYIL